MDDTAASRISWAQNGEDIVLSRALEHVQAGFYVDVGASDPEIDSVTKLFYDRGWSGLNIEPAPADFQRLRQLRPRDTNLNIAVSDTGGTIEMLHFPNTGLSTLHEEIASVHRAQGLECESIPVASKTLSDVLRQYQIQDIHFLKIDAEGSEESIIRGLDLTRHRPWIILYECTYPRTNDIRDDVLPTVLTDGGYLYAFFDGLNKYYVASEHAALLSKLYPVNALDIYVKRDTARHIQDLRDAANAAKAYAEDLERHLNARDLSSVTGTETAGCPIVPVMRRCVERHFGSGSFDLSVLEMGHTFFSGPANSGEDEPISRLLFEIYSARSDLQQSFDISTTSGRIDLNRWAQSAMHREYGVEAKWVLCSTSSSDAAPGND